MKGCLVEVEGAWMVVLVKTWMMVSLVRMGRAA